MRPVSRLTHRLRGANRKRPTPAWRRLAVRFLPAVGLVALLVSGTFWAWRTGVVADTMARVTAFQLGTQRSMGLVLRQVNAEGRNRTETAELARALAVFMDQPILMVDIEAARTQLERLPWVRSATVRRQLPDVLLAHLEEYRPLALWQEKQGSPVRLIDEDGTVIGVRNLRPFRELPLVLGTGAPKQARELLAILRTEPELLGRVTAATRVGERRWDLMMDGRVEVQLPAVDTGAAWRRLAQHQRKERLLERAVDRIDLRMPDRTVLKLMEEPTPPGSTPATAAKGGRGA